MTEDWELDGRQMPDQVLAYLRKIAVRAVEEQGYSPEVVMGVLGLSRSCMYAWLQRYQSQGLSGLESHPAPGAEAQVTAPLEAWLKETVLHSTPVVQGYDTRLWTRDILAAWLQERFGVKVTGRTISGHLKKLGLSYQKPRYRAVEQDPQEVAFFLEEKCPRIQRLAKKLRADIAFEDEAGIGVRPRSGRTWGLVGEPPEIRVTDRRGGYNVLSVVTGQGQMRYSVEAGHINSARYVEFLKQLLKDRTRPLILLADHASYHGSGEVRALVRAHRHQRRVFFLPQHSPELNPDEHVWEEVKDKRLGKQPIQHKDFQTKPRRRFTRS
jgi:transposase